ncbi:MAG: hypothetical protein QOE89_2201 [Pseudonocardiales bacterium]|jgi:glycosyltransferase-like protein|nr:hypothetical protein [Pseudonocardiales bacterium]
MRIAQLTYSTRPRGGVVHTLAIAEALAAAGHQVDVWSLARGGDSTFFRPVDPRVGLRLVPLPEIDGEDVGTRIVRSIKQLAEAFDPSGYDIVHAQDCISANAVPRCIRTIHHLDNFTTPELAACHERAIVRPYAHICVSAAVAAEVEDGWGIRAQVIPNGVDFGRFAQAATDGQGRGEWADQLGTYVLAVGGIEPRKGTTDLIEAMAGLQRDRPDVDLVIAGGETLFDYRDYRQKVFHRADELGVRMTGLGTVANDRLPALVAQAAAFAFPSVKEGFGLAAMEAMAAGTPVVMRDLPVLREIYAGAAAFANSPSGIADALLAAINAPPAGQLADARTLAARYSWPDAAEAHIRFYHRITDLARS